MPVVHEVRRDEDPLWYCARVDVGGKVVEAADLGRTRWNRCNRVINYQRVMLPYVERAVSCGGTQVIDRREAFDVLDTRSRKRSKH